MAISDTITSMYENVGNVYDVLELAGADLTNVDKNIENLKQSWEERLLYFLANGTDVVWNNWLPKVNGTGESITLNNTIQAKMDFVYKGNTSQESTTGKNKLPYTNDINETINSTKITGVKGTYTIQTTPTATVYQTYVNLVENYTIQSGDYLHIMNDVANANITFNLKCTDDTILSPTLNSLNRIFDLSSYVGKTISSIRFYVSTSYDGAKITLTPMIINSGTATEWEQFTFGASPNPNYPQEVNVVTGDNEVKVEGKNMASDKWDDYTYIGNYALFPITLEQGATYKLNATRIGELKPNYYNYGIIKDGTSYASFVGLQTCVDYVTGEANPTLTINVDSTWINPKLVCFVQGNPQSKFEELMTNFHIQFEKAPAKTDYELYQSQTYPINLGVKNLIDLNHIQPNNSDTFVSLIENGVRIKTQSGRYAGRIVINDLKQNTDYYLSYTWKDVSNGQNKVYVFAGTGSSGVIAYKSNGNGFTFNTGSNSIINIWFYAQTNVAGEVEYTNIQLEEGTVKHSYTPSWFEPIELCKIGDYQDYIVKSTGKNLVNVVSTNEVTYSGYGNFTLNNGVLSTTGLTLTGFKVKVEPSTQYTAQLFGTFTSGTNNLRIREFNSEPTDWNTGYIIQNVETIKNNDVSNLTVITSATTQWLLFVIYSDASGLVCKNMQLETGSTATNWEPYGKVWCKYGAIGKHTITDSDVSLISTYWLDSYGVYGAGVLKSRLNLSSTSTDKESLCNVSRKINGQLKEENTYTFNNNPNYVFFFNSAFDTIEHANAKLVGAVVYYALETPTITPITDTTLINQLEAIKLSYNEQTNISQTNTDKPFILDVTALKDLDAEDTTPTLTTNQGLLFTQPPVSENFINDEDDNSILEETINEEEPNIEDDNREEEEPLDFFEKEIINNDEEQEEIPTEPIEIDNGQR